MKVGNSVEVLLHNKRFVVEPLNWQHTKHELLPQTGKIIRETKTMWITDIDHAFGGFRWSKKTLKACGNLKLTSGSNALTRMDIFSIEKLG